MSESVPDFVTTIQEVQWGVQRGGDFKDYLIDFEPKPPPIWEDWMLVGQSTATVGGRVFAFFTWKKMPKMVGL